MKGDLPMDLERTRHKLRQAAQRFAAESGRGASAYAVHATENALYEAAEAYAEAWIRHARRLRVKFGI
jgi:hypothetical protein